LLAIDAVVVLIAKAVMLVTMLATMIGRITRTNSETNNAFADRVPI